MRRTESGDPLLVPDPDKAPVVRRAFELYASGNYSQKSILKFFLREGLLNRKGRRFNANAVNRILKNPVYAGWLVSKLTGEKPIRGNWEPLIGEKIYQRIQSILGKSNLKGVVHISEREEFSLKGFVYCASCGRIMTASWSKGRNRKYPYYHCVHCRGQNVRAEVMEKEFLGLLGKMQLPDSDLSTFKKLAREELTKTHNEATATWGACTQESQGTAASKRNSSRLSALLARRGIIPGELEPA